MKAEPIYPITPPPSRGSARDRLEWLWDVQDDLERLGHATQDLPCDTCGGDIFGPDPALGHRTGEEHWKWDGRLVCVRCMYKLEHDITKAILQCEIEELAENDVDAV